MNDLQFKYYFKNKDGEITSIKYEMAEIERAKEGIMHQVKQQLGDEWSFVGRNQCTGMKDKDGRVIYEGDIIKARVSDTDNIATLVVSYDYVNGCFVFIPAYFYEKGKHIGVTLDEVTSVNVVGNIFSTPKLLDFIEVGYESEEVGPVHFDEVESMRNEFKEWREKYQHENKVDLTKGELRDLYYYQ
ncbi:YopX family protein [Cytobacillus sp. Hm23]